jgi:hypothetical protein
MDGRPDAVARRPGEDPPGVGESGASSRSPRPGVIAADSLQRPAWRLRRERCTTAVTAVNPGEPGPTQGAIDTCPSCGCAAIHALGDSAAVAHGIPLRFTARPAWPGSAAPTTGRPSQHRPKRGPRSPQRAAGRAAPARRRRVVAVFGHYSGPPIGTLLLERRKTPEMAGLATLLQPVISVRCAPDRRSNGVIRGRPAQAGLLHGADSATTGIGTRGLSRPP